MCGEVQQWEAQGLYLEAGFPNKLDRSSSLTDSKAAYKIFRFHLFS
jgi:hypothetical protein